MDVQDFRKLVIERIRAFDNWAWKDKLQTPEEWSSDMTAAQWWEMFKDFIGGEFD